MPPGWCRPQSWTRAFRLAWPQRTRVFEVDLPDVLAFTETVLATHKAVPRSQRIIAPADLREDWIAVLTKAGFNATSVPLRDQCARTAASRPWRRSHGAGYTKSTGGQARSRRRCGVRQLGGIPRTDRAASRT